MIAKDLAQKYLSEEEIELLFSNVTTIYSLHTAFLKDLEVRYKYWDDSTCVGDVFLKHVPFWVNFYPLYCASYERGRLCVYEGVVRCLFVLSCVHKG
jgi:RhoGEF domain